MTKKGGALAKPKDFTKLSEKELLAALASDRRYEREQATAVLFESKSETLPAAIKEWVDGAKDDHTLLAALWLKQGRNEKDMDLLEKVLAAKQGETRAAGVRVLGDWLAAGGEKSLGWLKAAAADEHARVRMEAVRVLSRLPGAEAMDVALGTLGMPTDRFIEYALWLNVQEHGEEWLAALLEKKIDAAERGKALEFVLNNLPPAKATAAISRLIPKPLPKDASGPWAALGLRSGDAVVVSAIYEQMVTGGFDAKATGMVLVDVERAISQRQLKLAADAAKLVPLMDAGDESTRMSAIKLAATLADPVVLPRISALAEDFSTPTLVRITAISALGGFNVPAARETLIKLWKEDPTASELAPLALGRYFRADAVPMIAVVAAELKDPEQGRAFWQQVLSLKGISPQLAKAFSEHKLSPEMAVLTLQHIPDVAEHDALLKVLRGQAGSAQQTYDAARIAGMSAQAAEKGDAARGEMVYRRGALACTACHAIGGAGGKVGPDMTSIGASAPMDYLIESVVNPGAKVKEGYHSVIIETKDGKSIMGQLVRSGGSGSTIRDGAGQEVLVPDNMIARKTDAGSLMPGNLIATLPEADVNDLFKFLSSLGKPGDFDATKSRAPKTWAIVGLTTDIQEKASVGDPGLPWYPVSTTVNGRLLPEDAKNAAPGSGEIMAGTKLQLAEAARIELQFADGFKPTDIWINGKSIPSGTATLEPGIHKIVVRASVKDKPVRMTCGAGTFLPEW